MVFFGRQSTRNRTVRPGVCRSVEYPEHIPERSKGQGKLVRDRQRLPRLTMSQNPVLEATCTLASASCDFYGIFVCSAGDHGVSPPASNIAAIIQEIRTSMARSLSLFLSQCVSSKRADWFPSVLSFAVFVASVAMFMDAAVAMPAAARTELWEDVTAFCAGLRSQLYPTALDLLRIRANNDKQMAPLKLNCWNTTIEAIASEDTATPSPSSGTEPASQVSTGKDNERQQKFERQDAGEKACVSPRPDKSFHPFSSGRISYDLQDRQKR